MRFAAAGARSMDDAFVPLIDKIILFQSDNKQQLLWQSNGPNVIAVRRTCCETGMNSSVLKGGANHL
jgi:hypothetical protein